VRFSGDDRGGISDYPEKGYVTPSPRQYSVVGPLGVFAAVVAVADWLVRALRRKR
jgi:hypothetical protein